MRCARCHGNVKARLREVTRATATDAATRADHESYAF